MSVPLTADRFHRGLVLSLLDLIMTDSVLSTPPTNTPANHSRRGFLTQSALAGAAAAVALSIARRQWPRSAGNPIRRSP